MDNGNPSKGRPTIRVVAYASRPGNRLSDGDVAKLKANAESQGIQLELVVAKSLEESVRASKEADVLVTSNPQPYYHPDYFLESKTLKWVHLSSAGYDGWITKKLIDSPVIISHSGGVSDASISEHAIALMLMWTRNMAFQIKQQAQKKWNRLPPDSASQLDGRQVVVLGMGRIGSRIAQISAAMGMNVIGVVENPRTELPSRPSFGTLQVVWKDNDVKEALKNADFIILALSLNKKTLYYINKERLSWFKPTACLINIGRGKLIDEMALIQALQNKQLGGAALDVFIEEPLPQSSPLWNLPNVIITPHVAGTHKDQITNVTKKFIETFNAMIPYLLHSQPLPKLSNIVCKSQEEVQHEMFKRPPPPLSEIRSAL